MEVLKSPKDIDTNQQTVIIPFGLSYNPMEKLALINFEKQPDSVYKGLELQYFDDNIYGKGYRIIAYRLDGYVDVYDDISLNSIENENFDVAGKGLCEQKKVSISNAMFEKIDGNMHISFDFVDKIGRAVVVNIMEQTTKKTNGVNLVAPIGVSTEKPSYLPLFFLHDFDFIRKNKTHVELTIDGNGIKLDNFPAPAPKDFQWRYFSRYTFDCQIVEFANSVNKVLEECSIDASGLVILENLEYQYISTSLKRIALKNSKHPLYIEFSLGFPDIRSLDKNLEYKDTFKIATDDALGFISGSYSVIKNSDSVRIELVPSEGWTPVPNTLLTKIMFGKKSVFCNWPKTYRYIQNIDIKTLNSTSYWERIK